MGLLSNAGATREGISGRENLVAGSGLNLRDGPNNLFMSNRSPAGGFTDTDVLIYGGITHLLSPRTFYEVRVSGSVSRRDTSSVRLLAGINHISEAVSTFPIKDREGIYSVYREMAHFERFYRNRLMLKADLSSQINRRHFLKTGLELIRYNTWYQLYASDHPQHRYVGWYGKTYEDTDFFPGQQNQGVNPVQFGAYLQDKIELNGIVINAGIRYDVLFPNARVTDAYGFFDLNTPMWTSMSRSRKAPTVQGEKIVSWSGRMGVSHPMGERSVIRFFFGKSTQFPALGFLYLNSWTSEEAKDLDRNENGVIDSGERWNAFDDSGVHHSQRLPPEQTIAFEVGVDWNFAADYVLNLTTYYFDCMTSTRNATPNVI